MIAMSAARGILAGCVVLAMVMGCRTHHTVELRFGEDREHTQSPTTQPSCQDQQQGEYPW